MGRKKRKLKVSIDNPFERVIVSLVDFIKEQGRLSLARVESVLYDEAVIGKIRTLKLMFTSGQVIDEMSKFISKVEPFNGVKLIGWLFKEKLSDLFKTEHKKQKCQVGDSVISLIKEVVWMSYYIENKKQCDVKLFGSPFENLCRLIDIEVKAGFREDLYGLTRSKFITNVLSLKDGRIQFLKYADNICPSDLEIIAVNNGLSHNSELMWAIGSLNKTPYNPTEHYQMFKFVRSLVEEALYEKQCS